MGWECPPYIHVHSKGHRDIVAVKTLMRAAGISSLDLPREWKAPPRASSHCLPHIPGDTLRFPCAASTVGDTSPPQSLRYSGYITLIEIDYTNFGSLGTEDVTYAAPEPSWRRCTRVPHVAVACLARRYTYRVSKVKDTEFKAEEVMPGRGSLQHNRTLLDRHGLRFVVKQEGVRPAAPLPRLH